jgi:hypothetical protein
VADSSTPAERDGAEVPETTPSTAPKGSSDPASDADSDAGTAPESGAPSEDGPAVETIADKAVSTQDPSDIRDLGDRVSEEPIPDAVVEALEACVTAEDPNVRVAVCEACAEIPGDEAESILTDLRIDTNDRVAEAAMDAY